jgi:hypothetical protein
MKKITDDILWDFADGLLSNAQQKEIEQLLANNPALQQQLNIILQQKALFSSSDLERPNLDFSATLLEKWALEPQAQPAEVAPVSSNILLLKILFASFVALSLGLLYFAFSTNTVSEPLQIEIPNIEFPWSKISFILVSILAMLGVRLLEKMIVFRIIPFTG